MLDLFKNVVKAVGSKRLTAFFVYLLTFAVGHLLSAVSKTLGLSFASPDQVNQFAMWAAGILVAYIYSQMKIDVATAGETTTAAAVARDAVLEAAKASGSPS